MDKRTKRLAYLLVGLIVSWGGYKGMDRYVIAPIQSKQHAELLIRHPGEWSNLPAL